MGLFPVLLQPLAIQLPHRPPQGTQHAQHTHLLEAQTQQLTVQLQAARQELKGKDEEAEGGLPIRNGGLLGFGGG